ncbi:MAG: hypothetical protein ABI729_07500 [Chitinophagales bacterium]
MCALKVSLTFLEGPVKSIIARGTTIASSMNENKFFPVPPISPAGLQSVIDELKASESKASTQKRSQVSDRDVALADVRDFIEQNATYVENASKNDLAVLLSSGFEVQ